MFFIKNLEIVKKYPGMYFPSNTLIESTSFIAGMDMMQKEPVGEAFREWLLTEKLKSKSSFHWSKLVEIYMEELQIDSENQVEVFLELMFEFLKEDNAKLD